MWKKIVLALVFIAAIAICTPGAKAALLWSDGFEEPNVGDPPDPNKWNIYLAQDADITVDNSPVPPEGVKHCKIRCKDNDVNSGLAQMVSEPNANIHETSFWVQFDSYFDSRLLCDYLLIGVVPVTVPYDLNSGGGSVALSFRLIKVNLTDSTYRADIYSNAGSTHQTLISNLPFGNWERWVLGMQVTEPVSGKGKYWVYRNGSLLTDPNGVSYSPYSGIPADLGAVHIYTYDYEDTYETISRIDNVRIYNQNPLATQCGDPGTVYLDADFNLDCYVNFKDLDDFVGEWLQCTDPNEPDCDQYWL
ncbi:MAG: hypothetical protein ABIG61_12590 [Planctomycetota bacterium]